MDINNNRLSSAQKNTLWQNIIFAVFSILMILNGVADNTVYSAALVVYALMLMLCYPPEYLLIFCILTDSIQSYFLITPTLSHSRLLTFMYIIAVIIRGDGKLKVHKYAILFAVFAAYHVATSFWAVTNSFSESISFALGITMIILMMTRKLSDPKSFYRLLYFVSFLFVGYLFVMTFVTGGFSTSKVVFDEELNANTICGTVALFGAIIYARIWAERNSRGKLICFAFTIISILTILLVGSRTALAAYIGTVIILPIWSREKKKGFKISVKSFLQGFVSVALILVILVFLVNINSDILERFTFSGESMDTVDERFFTWEALWNYVIPNNLWFGIGYGLENIRASVEPYLTVAHHAHNIFFAILAETGIVGLILYIFVFLVTLRHLNKNPGYGATITKAMLLVGFLTGIGEEMINRRWFWLAVGFAFLLTNSQENAPAETDAEQKVR